MTELNYGFKKRTLRWRLVVFFLFVLALILIACELALAVCLILSEMLLRFCLVRQ